MVFDSFFLAGFECATGYNVHRQRIDQVSATQHDRLADEDYGLLRQAGILGAREAIRWPLVDQGGRYDFSTVRPFVEAGRKHGIKIIYDLFHFGYPEGIDLLSDEFPERFAEYCYAVARYISEGGDGECYFTPINEPSYFAWAAAEVGLFAPHLHGQGHRMKVALARAAIRGIDAIRTACPRARIVNVDPLCRMVAPIDRPDLQGHVDNFNRVTVFESWDMLSGSLMPELGGSPKHLDIVGLNYYWTNQWEANGSGEPLPPEDPRCWPLRKLVRSVWERYGSDILITETSHIGEMRPVWLRELALEAEALLDEGVPLRGACLYPILGMPEWHAQEEWTRMGLWDLVPVNGKLERVPYIPMLESLGEAQRRLEHRGRAWKLAGWRQTREIGKSRSAS
ncbi:MAG TPA: glycoside hydrolase [Blastocatellia bacterium]|nr:glycoside hydrolase [Blastocatellia bacterium]